MCDEGDEQRKPAAYHEAGHAVAAHLLRLPLVAISTVADKASTGHTLLAPRVAERIRRAVDRGWPTLRDRALLRRCLVQTLAGPSAEMRDGGGPFLVDWRTDQRLADDYVRTICSPELPGSPMPEHPPAVLDAGWAAAGALWDRPSNWRAVAGVAEALLARGELTGDGVREIIRLSKARR
jgi:hypothetical protein